MLSNIIYNTLKLSKMFLFYIYIHITRKVKLLTSYIYTCINKKRASFYHTNSLTFLIVCIVLGGSNLACIFLWAVKNSKHNLSINMLGFICPLALQKPMPILWKIKFILIMHFFVSKQKQKNWLYFTTCLIFFDN